MRKVLSVLGVSAMYLVLAGVTHLVTKSAIRPAKAAPAAGMATDCSPDSIWGTYNASGFHNPQKFGPFNGWAYAYHIEGKWSYTCPPPASSYSYSCAPCYKLYLFRNTAYPNGQNWVNQQRDEADFQVSNTPVGACSTGGVFNTTFTMTGLTAGQYEIQIEFGAGDDRRCYHLETFAHTFIVP
jgi:hypothetical protein